MTEHHFTLVFAGDFPADEPFDSMSDAVYEFVDDGTAVCRAGRASMTFDREADSFEEAVMSAVRDVAKAGFRTESVRTDESVVVAEINARLAAGGATPELATT